MPSSTRRQHGAGFARPVEPLKIRLFAEPDQLAARIAAVLLDDERARRRLVAHAVQQLERLPVDEAAERMRVFGHAAREQRRGPRPSARARTARRRAGRRARQSARPESAARSRGRRRSRAAPPFRRSARSAGGPSGSTPRAREPAASDRAAECVARTRHRRDAPCATATARRVARRSHSGARAAPSSRPGPGKRPRVSARK